MFVELGVGGEEESRSRLLAVVCCGGPGGSLYTPGVSTPRVHSRVVPAKPLESDYKTISQRGVTQILDINDYNMSIPYSSRMFPELAQIMIIHQATAHNTGVQDRYDGITYISICTCLDVDFASVCQSATCLALADLAASAADGKKRYCTTVPSCNLV